jgi:alkanesulfonate monooxygenase SsuD/methylene tetrahydromethanopterin reductase-like flavin-dependent oxidoreductase (luciferase family)
MIERARGGYRSLMQFGIDVAQQRIEWDALVERTRFGEECGFTGAWGFDHFQPMFGEGPGNCFEGMTTLAALASATSRIRLGLLVTGVTYRHPSLFAAQTVTIDHASHGRFDMSLGAAWFGPEHRSLGFEFPPAGARFDRLEDALEIVTRLMTGDKVSYNGHHVSLQDAQLRPRPVQQPHPPIWIGANGPKRGLPTAAKWADAWHSFAPPEYFEAMSRRIDDLAESAGRDPSHILRASSLSLSEPFDQVRRTIEHYRNIGVGYLVCGWPGEGQERVAEFAQKVMSDYAG